MHFCYQLLRIGTQNPEPGSQRPESGSQRSRSGSLRLRCGIQKPQSGYQTPESRYDECNIRNLYISAPEHCSKMRIAPLGRIQKTIFSMSFVTSWCIMTYVYHHSSENIDISNIKKLVVLNSFQKEWGVSVDQIINNQGASVWFSGQTLQNICIMIQLAS